MAVKQKQNFLSVITAADFKYILPPKPAEIVAKDVDICPIDGEHFFVTLDKRGFMWAKCADLILDPNNANQHNEESIESLRQSLRDYGAQKPIVVQRHTRIVGAGNGLLMAAMLEGWEMMRVSPTDLQGHEFTAHNLMDNVSAERSHRQFDIISQQLKAMEMDGFDLKMTGYKAWEIEPLLKAEWKPPTGDGENNSDATDANSEPNSSSLQSGKEKTPNKTTRLLVELQGESLNLFEWALQYLRETSDPQTTQIQALDAILTDWVDEQRATIEALKSGMEGESEPTTQPS
jgi:Predicted transcriptional regulators